MTLRIRRAARCARGHRGDACAGEYGGISHTPREYSAPEACGDGIDILANAIVQLANQPAGVTP